MVMSIIQLDTLYGNICTSKGIPLSSGLFSFLFPKLKRIENSVIPLDICIDSAPKRCCKPKNPTNPGQVNHI